MYPVIVWLREVWVVYLCDNYEHGCWCYCKAKWSLTCFPLCLLQGGGGGVRTLFKSSGRDKEGSGVGDEHVMSKVWLISSSRLFLLLLLLHKAVVWSLQIKASINKIAKLVFYKNKFLTCRSLLNIWFQGSFLLSSCSYMQLFFPTGN